MAAAARLTQIAHATVAARLPRIAHATAVFMLCIGASMILPITLTAMVS